MRVLWMLGVLGILISCGRTQCARCKAYKSDGRMVIEEQCEKDELTLDTWKRSFTNTWQDQPGVIEVKCESL